MAIYMLGVLLHAHVVPERKNPQHTCILCPFHSKTSDISIAMGNVGRVIYCTVHVRHTYRHQYYVSRQYLRYALRIVEVRSILVS